MPSSTTKLRVEMTADGRQVVRAFNDVSDASSKTAKQVSEDAEKQSASMEKVSKGSERLRGAVSNLAGMVGLGGLAFGFKDVIQAGMNWQQTQSQLQGALAATGQKSAAVVDQINRATEALATHGGFAAPEQIAAITRYIGQTHSATEALKANSAATDIARRLNLGYGQASTMVARAMTGTTGRLQQYLGIIQPVKTAEYQLTEAHNLNLAALTAQSTALGKAGPVWLKQQEALHGITPAMAAHAQLLDKNATATMVLQRIQERFGNATQRYSNTAAGAVSNLKNSFGILIDQIGSKLVPIITAVIQFLLKNKVAVMVVAGAVTLLAGAYGTLKVIRTVTGWAKELGQALGLLTKEEEIQKATTEAAAAAQDTLATSEGVTTAVTETQTGVMAALAAAMAAVPVFALIAGLMLLVTHFKTVEHVAVAVFDWIKGAVLTVVNWIKHHWELLVSILGGPFVAAWVFIATHLKLVESWISDAVHFIGGVFSTVFGILAWPFEQAWKVIETVAGAIADAVSAAVGAITHVVSSLFGWVENAISTVVNWVKHHWELLVSILGGPFVAAWVFIATHLKLVESWISDAVHFIGHIFSTVFHILAWPFEEAWKVIKKILDAVKDGVGLIGHALHAVGHFFGGVGHAVGSAFSSVGNFFGSIFHQGGLVKRFQAGGPVGVDTIPALLTQGEFVLRREAVQQIGVQPLNSINTSGSLPGAVAGTGGADQLYVTMPVTIKLAGGRILTEQVLHFAAKKSALSGHYVATSG